MRSEVLHSINLWAVAAKLKKKKKMDITADKTVEDEQLDFGALKDDGELATVSDRLPGKEVWEREAQMSAPRVCSGSAAATHLTSGIG